MTDRGQIISALERCVNGCDSDCPYEYSGAVTLEYCRADLMRDALTLLKADQSVIDQIEWERDTALEQFAEVDKSLGEKMDDLRELIQKRGRWVPLTGMAPPEYHGHKICSLCECFAPYDPLHMGHEVLTKYCPGCGAEMENGTDD